MTTTDELNPLSPDLAFLSGGGEATRLILKRDWTDHPMGPPQGWPDTFKVTLSALLNSPESMILSWGREELFFFFNETYFPLLGPRLDWAMGAPFTEVWADGWAQAKPIIDAAFEGRPERFIDLPWKLATDRGAEDTWWTFSYSRVLDPKGEIAGLLIFTNETTDKVLSNASRAETEDRLRLVIESARDHMIMTTDVGGVITSWSSGAEAILGWTAEEATGQRAAIIYTPEDQAAGIDVRELTTAALSGCANDERWHLTQAGERVFLNGSVHRLPPDPQGNPRGFMKIARDDTERWRSRQQLEALNSHLEAEVAERTADRNRLWQLTSDIMLVARLDGVIEAVNPAWTLMLGWSEDELVGRPLLSLIHPDDLDRTIQGVAGLSTGESYARFENRYRTRDGDYRDIVWNARPGDGRIIAVGRDATEDKARARALAETEAQLRQSQKMEAVGQLTGGIAHDFNNMLTGVIASLDLLRRYVAEGRTDRIERYMDAATTSAQRAAGLTHRLLAFSRRQSLDVQPVNVNTLVAGMEDLLRRTLGESIGLEVMLHAEAWLGMSDPNQLESALLNLAINARDAMPEGGRLTIETANARLDESYTDRVDGLSPGEFVVISVSDTGNGMSEEILGKAFEPFFTTKPIGSGTGLGLSMIYGFARQSGGHVRIYSEPGHGTTVKLYLPRHHGVELEVAVSKFTAPLEAQDGEQVLLVEDDPAVRMLIQDLLGDLGYGVTTAADGRSAIPLIEAAGRLDLLITDVGLPGLNGRQVAEIARQRRPGLKVLFITGYAERAAVRGEFLEEGMEMLTKPFDVDALAEKIREMITL